MPGGVISYGDFQASNGAFANDGGPWMVYRSYTDDINCGARQDAWCRDFSYCLACWVFPSSTQPSYTVSFFTNISFELDRYGSATQLDYEWSYAPWWGSSKSIVGISLPIKSSVGDELYTDTLIVGNWTLLQGSSLGWDGTPFSHKGTVNLETSPDKTHGYVKLGINITFPRESLEYINYYVKGASLKITTPTTIPQPVPTIPGADYPPTSSTNTNTGAIIGATLGAVGLIVLAVLGFLIFKHRHRNKTRSQQEMTAAAHAEVVTPVHQYGQPPSYAPPSSTYGINVEAIPTHARPSSYFPYRTDGEASKPTST